MHHGAESARAASALGARAFTVGNDVHFGAGQFRPGDKEGDRLLAHELTHVVQGGGAVARKSDGDAAEQVDATDVSQPSDPAEREADTVADEAADKLHGGEHRPGGRPGVGARPKATASRQVFRSPDPAAGAKENAAATGDKAQGAAGEKKGEEEQELAEPAKFRDLLDALGKAIGALSSGNDNGGEAKEGAGKGNPPAGGATQAQQIDPAGINNEISIGEFVTAAKMIEADWSKLTPAERITEFRTNTNLALVMAKVPPCVFLPTDLGDLQNMGKFAQQDWAIQVNAKFFAQQSLKPELAVELADTAYHEARLAEQFHKMARMMAEQNQPPEVIATTLRIPLDIVADAATKKIAPNTPEANEAQLFFDSVAGKDKAQRNVVLTQLKTATENLMQAEAAKKAKENDPNGAMDETRAVNVARNVYQRAMRDYKALPEEADAFAIGAKVASLYKKGMVDV